MFVVNSKSTITSSTFSLDIRYVVMCVTQVRMYGEFISVNREGGRMHDSTVTHKNSLFPHTSALRYPDSLRK